MGLTISSEFVEGHRVSTTDSLLMVTVDGSDSCLPKEDYCGITAPVLSSMMMEVFGASLAMSMDQGGSTTMWVEGANPDRDGIVSRSNNKEQTESGRSIANGLFVEYL